jgi:hypothetical protein
MSPTAGSVVNLADAKKERKRKKYADLVMKVFNEMEHADKRAVLDKAAEVQIAARERL